MLVSEKGSNKLSVVAGLNENGTPRTVKAKEENEPEFLKIDRHGGVLENFMSNFLRQCKDPTHFHFFRAPLEQLESVVSVLQEMLKNPENPSNKELLDQHRILPEAFSAGEYRPIDESCIDWTQFENLGVSRQMLDEKAIHRLLNWQKTPALLPIKAEIGETVIRTDARLSLRETPGGKLGLVVHAVRSEPQLDGYVYGIRLGEEDKQSLLRTGHAGRLVEVEPVRGEKMDAFLSIDPMTNELVAVRADRIKIPDQLKGLTLDQQQKRELSLGKAVYLEGMTSKSGKAFNATVQVNADRRSLEFKFDNANKLSREQQQADKQGQSQPQDQKFRIPDKLLGVELSKEQQDNLRENKTIYVSGMTDKAGGTFNAYIKVNAEKEKLDFYKWNPDRAKKQGAEVTPDNASRTQVAVNSEGKTNEATKNVNEALKAGQTHPTGEQQQKQEQQRQKPKGIRW